jgi:transposase
MSYIQGENRNQHILFPQSLEEYIDKDNPVRIIDEYIKQLDLIPLNFKHATDPRRGRPPYHPALMLKLYLYGYLNHIRSSRRLETESGRNVELMWLLRKLRPDFKTIADFRKDNKKALVKAFRDFTHLCNSWQLFGKELIAIDGSKFRASNSKRNNYSKQKLARHINYINEKIANYLKELDVTDQAEAHDHKPDVREIQERIAQLKERKAKYQGYKDKLDKTKQNEISAIDPDARLMANNNNSVKVSYNVQTTVDGKHKLIVDFKVTNKPNDLGQLAPMALRIRKILNNKTFTVLADKGYYHARDLAHCFRKGITTYVTKQVYSNSTGDKDFYPDKFTYDPKEDCYLCPTGKRLYYYRNRKKQDKIIGKDYRNLEACQECPAKSRCTKNMKGRTIFRSTNQDFLDDIDRKTQENLATYKLRQMIVEHPFGTIKRAWGASYFLTRRKASVNAEMALSFLAYNIRRVINILGTEEMIRRLQENKRIVLAS